MAEKAFDSFLQSMIREAGQVLRSLSATAGHDCDLVVNKFITDAIRREYPDHHHISEEESRRDIERDAFTWVVDPIDGSENFYRGILSYTLSVSLVRNNEILVGAVYEPYVDRLYFAARGEGATMNGDAIHVSSVSDLKRATCAISGLSSFRRGSDNGDAFFRKVTEAVYVRITASTALDMCYVAAGAIEARVMADTKIWDNSAATLIVREAGGKVTDWNGRSDDFMSPRMVASNAACHEALLELLEDEPA